MGSNFRKITAFMILFEQTHLFNDRCAKLLKEGWQPYKDHKVSRTDTSTYIYLSQAFVKYAE
jgi:hypothetical protein